MTFYIETFGCQMNKSDSDVITLSLKSAGYKQTHEQKQADIVIFNTCSVRKNAEDRARARLMEASNRRPEKPLVIAAGCLAQHIGDKLIAEGLCDIAVGPYNSPELPSLIAEFEDESSHKLFTSVERTEFSDRLHPGLITYNPDDFWHRWVTITHGCENFCTYCIVPYVRGPLLSIPSMDILEFIRKLPDQGVIEITLLGQNVNQYGQDSDDMPFYKLLEEAASVPGILKVNFLTSHPKDLDDNIISVMEDHDTVAKHLHLPLQSGSDRILQSMNRSYTKAEYMRIVERLNRNMLFSITTDIIVGFPGESDEDYEETLQTVKEVSYDDAYMYAYSPREGTESADYNDQVSTDVKSARLTNLIELQRAESARKMKRYLGLTTEFIAEKVSRKNEKELNGKTMLNHQLVAEATKDTIGKMTSVKISDIRGATLYGTQV